MTVVLFWDIDGTLLTTARAGIRAWEGAISVLASQAVDLSTFETAGFTDVEIARRLLCHVGLDASAERQTEVLRRYETLLPDCLPLRAGRVLPGVCEILEDMRARPGVLSLLLTGNTMAGARAKLTHYGLTQYFSHGVFADGCEDRPSIARKARDVAAELVRAELEGEQMYVIGDTPHDIACARSIGARAIAVATGVYTAESLRAHEPWCVMPGLPSPAEFAATLRLPC